MRHFTSALLALLLPFAVTAGTAELTDKSKTKIATLSDNVMKDADGKVLYTIAGNNIYEGADTAGHLLYTVGEGDVLAKTDISVTDKDGKVFMTTWYGQFAFGVPPGHQDFTYLMGYFTEAKEGKFKVKEKLIGQALGEVTAGTLSGVECVTVFLVYMEKYELDDHAEKRIKEKKEADARAAAAAAESSSGSSSGSGTSSGRTTVYLTIANKCNHDVEWSVIDVTTSYNKMGAYGSTSLAAWDGAKICIKTGGGYTTVCVVSAGMNGQTVVLCNP